MTTTGPNPHGKEHPLMDTASIWTFVDSKGVRHASIPGLGIASCGISRRGATVSPVSRESIDCPQCAYNLERTPVANLGQACAHDFCGPDECAAPAFMSKLLDVYAERADTRPLWRYSVARFGHAASWAALVEQVGRRHVPSGQDDAEFARDLVCGDGYNLTVPCPIEGCGYPVPLRSLEPRTEDLAAVYLSGTEERLPDGTTIEGSGRYSMGGTILLGWSAPCHFIDADEWNLVMDGPDDHHWVFQDVR